MLKNKNNFEIINSFFHCWAENFSEHLRILSLLFVVSNEDQYKVNSETHSINTMQNFNSLQI